MVSPFRYAIYMTSHLWYHIYGFISRVPPLVCTFYMAQPLPSICISPLWCHLYMVSPLYGTTSMVPYQLHNDYWITPLVPRIYYPWWLHTEFSLPVTTSMASLLRAHICRTINWKRFCFKNRIYFHRSLSRTNNSITCLVNYIIDNMRKPTLH